ncbi:MAG: glycosyltransferase family 4 protein, partial [Pseudomonadota bacterium]
SPVEEWDAVICTSKAVQSVVAHELDVAATYLTRRFAARRVPMPQLPIIPLGTDSARFAHDPAARTQWRQQYGFADDDIAIMTMGRLSVFEKMHPAPLFLALQRAAMETERKLHLLMVGWFGDENTEKLHREAAAELAPDVDVIFPDGKDPDLRYSIWSAADIFALPVDNIQETFGLAPIEAMAAGLPVVCSDWNGFKDTVVDGETGYRVRTLMSAPGMGTESAHRFEDGMDNYFQYLGLLHQRTQVDVPELASAFVALINDPEKRARMGKAAAERAQAMYDWAAIIPQYQALWSDLTARRLRGQPSSPRETGEPANPASIDPFVLYQKYPTDRLPVTAILSVEKAVTTDDVARMVHLTGAEQLKRMVAGANQIAAVCETINTDGPIRLDTLIQKTKLRQDLVMACVLWMAKFDLVQIRV